MAFERYTVEHETRYAYTAPVSQSWQLARLTPRPLPWQKLLSHSLQIDPPADERHDAPDSFGNSVTHFGLHGAHRVLSVRMACSVEVGQRPVPVEAGEVETWASVVEHVRNDPALDDLNPARLCEPTQLVPMSDAAHAYAEPSLAPERDWLEALRELTHRIHAEFEFEPGATTVSTSVDEVLAKRHGVCQRSIRKPVAQVLP